MSDEALPISWNSLEKMDKTHFLAMLSLVITIRVRGLKFVPSMEAGVIRGKYAAFNELQHRLAGSLLAIADDATWADDRRFIERCRSEAEALGIKEAFDLAVRDVVSRISPRNKHFNQ